MKKSQIKKIIRSVIKEQMVAPGPVSQTMAQGGQAGPITGTPISPGGVTKPAKPAKNPNTSPVGQTRAMTKGRANMSAVRIKAPTGNRPIPLQWNDPIKQRKAQKAASHYIGKTYEQIYAELPPKMQSKFPTTAISPRQNESPAKDARFLNWLALAIFLHGMGPQNVNERSNRKLRNQYERQRRKEKQRYFREMAGVNEAHTKRARGDNEYIPPKKGNYSKPISRAPHLANRIHKPVRPAKP